MLLLCRYELYGLVANALAVYPEIPSHSRHSIKYHYSNIFDIYMFNVLLQKLFVDNVSVETHGSRHFPLRFFQLAHDLN